LPVLSLNFTPPAGGRCSIEFGERTPFFDRVVFDHVR
jgi:hypothetical protein